MTHLRIELNTTGIEEVSGAVIAKLYDIVHSGTLDNTSNLLGRLHTTATYLLYIDYLQGQFDGTNDKGPLYIDATKKYIMFTDPEVTRVLATQYGDGVGITATDALSITSLGSNIFRNNTDITLFNELSLLNVTSLSYLCFYGCTNLSSIDTSKITTFGESSLRSIAATTIDLSSATSLGDHLFEGNTALTSVTLDPNKVITYVGKSVFSGCLNLEGSFDFSNSTFTKIDQAMFYNCKKITSITLPSTVTSIVAYGLLSCSLLNSINLLNVTTIGSSSFSNDTSLTILDLSSLTLSGSRCFLDCTGLTSVTFNSSVNLADYTFNGCTSLTTITGSDKITSIGNYCFLNCSSLTGVLDLSNATINSNHYLQVFMNCSSLTEIKIGNTALIVTSRANSNRTMFYNCSNLKIVDVNSVTKFSLANPNIFAQCPNMKAFVLRCTTVPTINIDPEQIAMPTLDWSHAFGDNQNLKIYVPDVALNDYKTASEWSNIATHIFPLSDYNEATILAS